MTDDRLILADVGNLADWTALSNDTTGLAAATTLHLWGKQALFFNKVNGTANKEYAGASRVIGNLNLYRFDPADKICWTCYCSALTNVHSCFVRIGTDASNYTEYRYPDSSMTAGVWAACKASLSAAGAGAAATGSIGLIIGNGADMTNIAYLAVGVNFDSQANELAGIMVGDVYIEKVRQTA